MGLSFFRNDAEQFIGLFTQGLFDEDFFAEFMDKGFNAFSRAILVGVFSSAKDHFKFYLVPFIQKLSCERLPDLPIVLSDLEGETHPFHFDPFLVRFGFPFLFFQTVLVRAVVKKFAHRRACVRSDFNEVKSAFLRHAQCFRSGKNSD
jgi:hypothetical protein